MDLVSGWEAPLEEEMAPTPVFLPGESHGRRSLAGYSPRACKELGTTERVTLLLFAFLTLGRTEEKMAHSAKVE